MKLFVFGATGDLFKRKVLEWLQSLNNKDLEVIAIGRKNFSTEIYQDFICNGRCNPEFKNSLTYKEIEFTHKDIYTTCSKNLNKDEINYFYISLPPHTFDTIINVVWEIKANGYQVQLLLEKPFGHNFDNAKQLKETLIQKQLCDYTYLSDHFMFKDTILQLKQQDFKSLEIGSLETVWLEDRAGYYEGIGAMKDMIQSHFLNIAFKLINSPKEEFENFEINKQIKAQYNNYEKELWNKSTTETFVDLEIETPSKIFHFITGKAFKNKKSWIKIDEKEISLESGNNPYIETFKLFFEWKKEEFPTIDNALLSREIINNIEEQKTQLLHYPENQEYSDTIFK